MNHTCLNTQTVRFACALGKQGTVTYITVPANCKNVVSVVLDQDKFDLKDGAKEVKKTVSIRNPTVQTVRMQLSS